VKRLSKDRRCPGRDWNQAPAEYESRMVPLRQPARCDDTAPDKDVIVGKAISGTFSNLNCEVRLSVMSEYFKFPVGNKHIKLRGFCPRANYADRATSACWRSSANFC
jgi:hypothetical protein